MHVNFFDKKFSYLLLFLGGILLFLPKINLVQLNKNETAGIRADDFILFFVALLLVWGHFILEKKLIRLEKLILLLTGFSLLSFILNQFLFETDVLHIKAKIFYVLRPVEYFLFFYVGLIASRLFIGDKVIKVFFLWNFLLMILQKLQFTGAISSEGYQTEVSSRVYGVASFPSEMGLILNLLFCYFAYRDDSNSDSDSVPAPASKFLLFFSPNVRYVLKKMYLPLLFAVFGTLIVFTGNRISILALILCFLFRMKEVFNPRSLASLIGAMLVGVVLFTGFMFVISKTHAVYERSSGLISWSNLELGQVVWNKIDLEGDPLTQNTNITSEGYDMSWWIRIHKWVFMIKCFVMHPLCYLQGLGPGFSGAALDGGILRIITEYGLIGSYIFRKYFQSLSGINRQTKWMMVAFMFNMIFFDAYLAYKAMSVLLFICGYLKGNCEQEVAMRVRSSVSKGPIFV